MRFLFRWQHVAPASRLHGVDGTLQVIRQLEGYEIPAAAWETTVLPARVADYKREYLDQLCYAGDVMWGRLSPHPALTPSADGRQRRIRPTKLAPIALFARENAAELIVRDGARTAALSHAAREVLDEIAQRGAPFFADIVRGTQTLAGRSRRGAVAARRRGPRHGRRLRCAARARRPQAPPGRKRHARAAALVGRPLDAHDR